MPIDMSCGQAMLALVPNPLASLLFLRIFMSQSRCFEIHVNTVMGDADLKHLSYRDLQHPSPKSTKPISLANDLCLALVKGLPGSAHVLADCRFLFALCIAFLGFLDSPARDFHIQCNLLCSHTFLLLADNPMDLALV
jgi:hypothetical protein